MNTNQNYVEKEDSTVKSDARVRYTRNIIRKVFYELLSEKPVEKITVRELCERAEINRGTFYKHYMDIYDLRDSLEEEAVAKFIEQINTIRSEGNSGLTTFLKDIRSYYPFFPANSSDESSRTFAERIGAAALDAFENSSLLEGTEKNSMIHSFMCAGAAGMIEYWIRSGQKESPEEISKAVLRCCEAIVHTYSVK